MATITELKEEINKLKMEIKCIKTKIDWFDGEFMSCWNDELGYREQITILEKIENLENKLPRKAYDNFSLNC